MFFRCLSRTFLFSLRARVLLVGLLFTSLFVCQPLNSMSISLGLLRTLAVRAETNQNARIELERVDQYCFDQLISLVASCSATADCNATSCNIIIIENIIDKRYSRN